MSDFHEYKYVIRHTTDLALLERLWEVRLDPSDMESIVAAAVRRFGWTMVVLSCTGRTDRGRYYSEHFEAASFGGPYRPHPARIVVAPNARAEVFAHELAHHGVANLTGPATPHGIDFVGKLDSVAGFVADWLWAERGIRS